MNLRRRLEQSDVLASFLAWLVRSYLRFAFATSRWDVQGRDQLNGLLADGPVNLVLWHGRLAAPARFWPLDIAMLSTIHDTSPAGRVGASVYRQSGFAANLASNNVDNVSVMRRVLSDLKQGNSLGMAADGPKGPARKVRRPTIDWARKTQRPVVMFTWSAKRAITLNSWDSLMLPVPFSRGRIVFREWDGSVPKRLSDREMRQMRKAMTAALDDFTDETDRAAGRSVRSAP